MSGSTLDGLSATPYPSGVRNVPVEISEAITPMVIWRKELRLDSGGPGAQRGGLGQVMEVTSRENAPFGIFASFERVHYPARGRDGAGSGEKGRLLLESGAVLRNKGIQTIPTGDRLIIEMPGGGGYGDPMSRDPAVVADDVRHANANQIARRTARDLGLAADGQRLLLVRGFSSAPQYNTPSITILNT